MKKIRIKQIVLLQAIVIIYTFSGIMAKFASGSEFFWKFMLFMALDVMFLGIYAVFWQQMIKIFSLSVAYANRAMALLWSALWANIIFKEEIGLKQMVGIGLVIVGTMLINTEAQEESKHE